MKNFASPNSPLNVPALETLEAMTGFVPNEIRDQILGAPFDDDLSGLRLMSQRFQEPDKWRGTLQPKNDIANYVEAHGVKVPRRILTLDEALYEAQHGSAVVFRSEHPQEYDHYSGLLRSYSLNDGTPGNNYADFMELIGNSLTEDEILPALISQNLNRRPIQRYLQLTGQSEDQFSEDISFSYWQYIKGKNITVVADDVIAGRYHLTCIGDKVIGGGIFNEGGQPFNDSDTSIDSMSRILPSNKIAEIIATYEKVRALPRFPERQCPIMEMQVDETDENGDIYFLQYHKARPFRPFRDRLDAADYSEKEGWLKAQAVRGALGSFVTLNTALWYPDSFKPDISEPEQASFDLHHDTGLSEALSRRRIAYLSMSNAREQYINMADGAHELRSRWFKPFAGLALGGNNFRQLIPEESSNRLAEQIYVEGKMGRYVIDLASDGLNGYVRLSPDSDQPVIRTRR